MSTSRILGWQLFSTALASGVLIGVAPAAFANPSGGQVVGGSASISAAPGTTTIDQSSKKAIIDWQRFSIAPGETTRFNQPGSDAIALNRVRGAERSDLFGRLEANGQVWLVNPNGVLIGPGAKIDVGGFLATTADIRDPDFFAGRYDFAIPSPQADVEVVNQGTISVRDSGLAALVAPHARNDGLIEGRYSQVVLAGAPTFAFDFYGDGLINFQLTSSVTQAGDPSRPLVDNAGTIRTEGGRVLMTAAAAGGVVDSVIDVSGVVEARTFAMRDGEIVLQGADHGIVAVAGTLDASGNDAGEHGGTVKVLGEKVALYDGARVDVAGDAGGGTALVGGNFQGKGPERNAKRTYVAKNAKVAADAVSSGDGGKVIVWADEVTGFAGSISARGGAQSGNGGLVEVSGKQSLGFTGTVDLAGPNGNNGSLLLDPDSIVVTDDGANDDEITDNEVFFEDGDGDFSISASALEALDGDIILQANNDISIEALLELFNLGLGETFSVQAGRDITVNAGITTSGGNVHLEADSPHSPTGGADAVGIVLVGAPILTTGGRITLIGNTINWNVPGLIQAGTGNIDLRPSVFGFTDLAGIANTSGALTIGRATTRGALGNGLSGVRLTTGSIIFLNPIELPPDAAGQLIIIATDDATFSGALTVNQPLTVQVGRDIAVNAALTTNGNALHLEADSPHAPAGAADGFGGITVNAPISTDNGSIVFIFASPSGLDILAPVQAGGSDVRASTSSPLGGASGSDLRVVDQEAFDNLFTTGALIIGDALTRGPEGDGVGGVRMTAGTVSIDGPIAIPATTAGAVFLVAGRGINVNTSLTANQNLSLQAQGAITIAAPVTTSANLSITTSDPETWQANLVQTQDVSAGGEIVINTDGAMQLANLTAGGGIRLITFDDLTRQQSDIRLEGIVTAGGEVELFPDGSILQDATSSIRAPALKLLPARNFARSADLRGSNQVASLTAPDIGEPFVPFAIINLNNTGPLSVAEVSAGSVDIHTLGRLTSDGPIVATGGGTSILLVTRGFSNNAGPNSLQPGLGRFLVYSVDPAQDATGGLVGQQRFDSSFTSVPHDSPLLSADVNYFLYETSLAAPPPPPLPPQPPVVDDVPPSVFNPVLSVGDLGESTASGSPAQVVAASAEGTSVVAFAPAQAHLLPQVQRALDESTVDPLYSNDGNRDLWGLATFLSPVAASPSAEMGDAR